MIPSAQAHSPRAGEVWTPEARLRPGIYGELRNLAERLFRRERRDHTLEPTALVHEAWLKLSAQERTNWDGGQQMLALGAQAMRRILVDHARARRREKRGGDRVPAELTDDLTLDPLPGGPRLLDLDGALARLERLDPRQAKVVELRFFAGMGVREVARELGLSVRTIEADWTAAKAWLRRELKDRDGK